MCKPRVSGWLTRFVATSVLLMGWSVCVVGSAGAQSPTDPTPSDPVPIDGGTAEGEVPMDGTPVDQPLPADCSCPRPSCPTTLHQSLITRYSSISTIEVIDTPIIQVVKGPWWHIDPCFCSLYRPPEVCPTTCPSSTFTSTVAEQICWSVTGTASAAVKFNLLGKVLDSLTVTVTVAGTYQKCVTITSSRAHVLPSWACWHRWGREVHTKKIGSGHTLQRRTCDFWIQEKISWPGEPAQYIWVSFCQTTSCDQEIANATATADVQFDFQLPPRLCESSCGGPCPLPDPPDQYENKRCDPCCRPLPPCDVLAPGQDPCCGCIVEQ